MAQTNPLGRIVRVEITDKPIIPGRSGVKDNRPWTIPSKHPAWLWQDDQYPTSIEIPVPESGPYKPGLYLLAGVPLTAGVRRDRIVYQFDDRDLHLIAVEEVAKAVAALAKAA